ncbi:MAG: formate dehydrogenase accessory sulfurtransferase FdhD [Bacillota bacterium]
MPLARSLPAPATRLDILRLHQGSPAPLLDQIAVEYPLTLELDGVELVTLLCTPEHLDELAVGHLVGEGVLREACDLKGVDVDPQAGVARVATAGRHPVTAAVYGKRAIASGCGRGLVGYQAGDLLGLRPVADGGAFLAQTVLASMRRLGRETPLFAATGGAHGVGLSDAAGDLTLVREDIGRHNALDKVVGRCFLDGHTLAGAVIYATGRLSSEMVLKAVRAKAAMVASHSAPTSLAVELAEALNLTLVGFARGERLNVYTHPRRLAGVSGETKTGKE